MENALYDYWPIVDRPKLTWPDGAKVAFWLGLNVEHYQVDKHSTRLFGGTAGLVPDPLNHGWRAYGPRVGVWRIVDGLDRHRVPGSVLLNSEACRRYPRIIEAGNERGRAWLAHGRDNSTLQSGFSEDEERRYLAGVVRTVRDATGTVLRGWLGPTLIETFATPRLLAELGLSYVLDWCNDDQPYPLNVDAHRMISVPYSIKVNDVVLCVGRNLSGDDLYRLLCGQPEVLLAAGESTGQVVSVGVQPFILGRPFWVKYLDCVLREIAATPDVWATTSDDIAETYLAHHYDTPRPRCAQPVRRRPRRGNLPPPRRAG